MSLFSKLKKMLSDSENAAPESFDCIDYQGFSITPQPMNEDGQFRVSGWIRKGELEHRFIRADVLPSSQVCADETVRKAKLLIDQQGGNLFR